MCGLLCRDEEGQDGLDIGWDGMGTRDNEGLVSSFFARGTRNGKGDESPSPSTRGGPAFTSPSEATNHWQPPFRTRPSQCVIASDW